MFWRSHKPPVESEYKFAFKEGALSTIMRAKGWKSYQDVATATGYTRQYISSLDKPNGKITDQFMISLALALGSLENNWWVHYKIVKVGRLNRNHQSFNMEKYEGRIPYAKYSVAAELRRKDGGIETL